MEIELYGLIEKEDISSFHFPLEEVLKSTAMIQERDSILQRAIALGNLEHQKVLIYFSDDEGQKKVHTTIWAITDSSIVLKQNVIIPINRIHKLEI